MIPLYFLSLLLLTLLLPFTLAIPNPTPDTTINCGNNNVGSNNTVGCGNTQAPSAVEATPAGGNDPVDEKKKNDAKIIGSVVGAVVAVGGLAATIYFRRRQARNQEGKNRPYEAAGR
ncbi:hypothetical protein HDV00_006327 [Rhizophlyctis rosea]|nr:hypothetical protein HDV00_006327 [Rhizophlyctis rosea]